MPCKCPRSAHSKCVARWQLQSAGTRKETHCEFCDGELPAWKETFIPAVVDARADPIMNITFNGVTRGFRVAPGPEGYKKFTSEIQKAFKLPPDADLNITFTCDEPVDVASRLMLKGKGAYDAAVACASISAARRVLQNGEVRQQTSWKASICKAIPAVESLTRRITCVLADLSCMSTT